jgi:hypothetical protein
MHSWETERKFIDGASEEDLQMSRLSSDITNELQHAASTAAVMAMSEPKGGPDQSQQFLVWIRDIEGKAVENARVFIFAGSGIYSVSVTNKFGQAAFTNIERPPSRIFVVHREFQAACVERSDGEQLVSLTRCENAGSMVTFRGWQSLEGFPGGVEFTQDQDGRMFMYAENIAVNGSRTEPAALEIGQPVFLDVSAGPRATMTVKAVCGPCLLIDVVREC